MINETPARAGPGIRRGGVRLCQPSPAPPWPSPRPPIPLIKTAVPGWDNDPRRQGAGTVLHGATPALYQAWLEDLIRHARAPPGRGRGPGLHQRLERVGGGRHAGAGRALGRRLPERHRPRRRRPAGCRARAPGCCWSAMMRCAHGAQTLLLQIGRRCGRCTAWTSRSCCWAAARWRPSTGPSPRPPSPAMPAAGRLPRSARAAGCTAAIVNSAASARAVPALERHGIATVLLVHELPRLLREKGLLAALRQGWPPPRRCFPPNSCGTAAATPWAAAAGPVGSCRRASTPPPCGPAAGRPRSAPNCACPRHGSWRSAWAMRTCARASTSSCKPGAPPGPAKRRPAFAWAGGIDPATQAYLGTEIAAAEATGTFRYLGRRATRPPCSPQPTSSC